ncbi:MAG: EcsC family protein [Nitriliruptorales bacterium]
MNEDVLESYERSVVHEVQQWLNREPGWTGQLLGGVSDRSRQALDLMLTTEWGRRTLRKATERAVGALEGVALRGLADQREASVVPGDSQNRQAMLRRADERAGQLRNLYVGLLGVQGGLVGAASLTWTRSAAAIVADVAIAVAVTLRAAAHHLAVYRVAPSRPSVLEAAVEVVAVATETDAAMRQHHIAGLSRGLLENLRDDELDRELSRVVIQQTSSRAVKEAVEQTVRRVLRGRLAGLVPVLGAATGGATSAWLAAQVCEAARQVGRVTFLARHTPLHVSELLAIHAEAAAAPS